MLRNWMKSLAFLAGGVLAVGAAYGVSEKVDPVHRQMKARVKVFSARAARVEAVSVGNSHSLALDFGALGMTGIHFWDGGQDAFESEYLARFAADRAPRLRFVMMAMSYGGETLDHGVMKEAGYRTLRRAMYARAPRLDFLRGDANEWLAAQISPVVRTDHWRGAVYQLRGRRPPVPITDDGRFPRAIPRYVPRDSLAQQAAMRLKIHTGQVAESLHAAPDTPARAVALLERLADDLRARGVLLVLYTPPYYPAYLERVPPEMIRDTRRHLAPLLAHPNVVWVDFADDAAFTRSDDNFRDSDHLSARGSRAFSMRLRACLDGARRTESAVELPAGCRRVPPPVASRGHIAATPHTETAE